jgi:hypothetical protein
MFEEVHASEIDEKRIYIKKVLRYLVRVFFPQERVRAARVHRGWSAVPEYCHTNF